MLKYDILFSGGDSMTMLVAIKNKNGMVLTSDTKGTGIDDGKMLGNDTTYKKSFKLRDNKPIGVMICGNARIMNAVTVEEIVSNYKETNRKDFSSFDEYLDDFINYIKLESIFGNTQDNNPNVIKLKRCYIQMLAQELSKKILDYNMESPILKEICQMERDEDKIMAYFEKNEQEINEEIYNELTTHIDSKQILGLASNGNILPTIIIGGYGDEDQKPMLKKFVIMWVGNGKIIYAESEESEDINLFGVKQCGEIALNGMLSPAFTKLIRSTSDSLKDMFLDRIDEGYLDELIVNNEHFRNEVEYFIQSATLEQLGRFSQWLIKFTQDCLEASQKECIVGSPDDPIYLHK